MEETKKTYTIIAHCTNCGHTKSIDIPFGITKMEGCKYEKCNNCGCGMIPSPHKNMWKD